MYCHVFFMYFRSFYLPNPCASSGGGGGEIFVKKKLFAGFTDPPFLGGEASPTDQKQTKQYSK